MKVLVTGGAGFIGSHLVEGLLEKKHEVVVLDNLSTGKKDNLPEDITFINGDITDKKTVLEASKDAECIFHLAALVSVQEAIKDPLRTEKINSLGTLNILEAARRSKVRKVVFSSSASVYGDNQLPNIETQQTRALSPYAITKSMGEYYCKVYSKLHKMDTVSLRYFNVFGPRQDPSSQYSGVISIFIDRLKNGKTPVIYGNGLQTRDFIYVKDVVRANILSMEKETMGETINIATSIPISINEIGLEINRLLGTHIIPNKKKARAGEIKFSYADVTKAKEILGFVAEHKFTDGLKKTIS